MSKTELILNPDMALRVLKERMTTEMQQAAEPIIQAAVAEAEKAIRARTAAMVVSLIEGSFSVQRMGPDLRIVVEGFGK